MFLIVGLTGTGILSLGVVPAPVLLEEARKPVQIEVANDVATIQWFAHPDVFYFVEGSPDLTTWITAKLLKDATPEGSLTLATSVANSKAFYRLDLEGDPGAARLREDSDGDGIINLLEAQAGLDAFVAEDATDSDGDGVPDYFEQFHFGTLAHDASYIATTGGLTLAEAYANATDPNKVDSDDDGWTDRQELAWGWDPNYDQSRDDPNYGPDGDFDGDGLTNLQEQELGFDPTTSDNPGIVQEAIKNGDFDEPEIGTGLEGGTKWDYWAGIPGWEAHVGTNIEIQKKFYTDPYCELEAESAGHTGIKQIVGTKKGQTYLLMFDYATRPDVPAPKSNFDLEVNGDTIKEIRHSEHSGWQTEVVAFEAKDVITEIIFIPTGNGDTTGGFIDKVTLLKMDVEIHDENGNSQIATEDDPANVPVNGDFDEEKQVNGRYVRDYEDANLEFATDSNDLKTDDLRGCVVDISGLTDDAWQNTTLKIRKKPGVIDPLTDEEEAGEIRIHAIDGSNNWVEVPLDTDLEPDYYVSTGQYADYDSCWIEGIKDGPITIEVEVVINGGTPILIEKKAMICTEKSKAEWLEDLRDEILLIAGEDINDFAPSSGFFSNKEKIQAVYEYYEKLYCRNTTAYQWAGMAKLAGAPVYAGLSDLDVGIDLLRVLWPFTNFTGSELNDMQRIFMEMNLAVYNDMAWQFKAYHTSGLCALEYVAENEVGTVIVGGWRSVDAGFDDSNTGQILDGNNLLLRREQELALAPGYSALSSLNYLDFILNWAKNPIPTSNAKSFEESQPSGSLDVFNDRWNWIMDDPGGIWTEWVNAAEGTKKGWVEIPLLERKDDYDYF